MSGSGLLSNIMQKYAHELVPGKSGAFGLLADIIQDIVSAQSPLAAIVVEEFTAPLAPATNNLMAATATPAAGVVQTLLPATVAAPGALTKATIANLAAAPRQLEFTSAVTTAGIPATATVSGSDERGNAVTEVVPLSQTSGSVYTQRFYSNVTQIVYSAGVGAGSTIAIGLGGALGLSRTMKKRAGVYGVIQEINAGAIASTAGTFKSAEYDNVSATVVGTANLVAGTPTFPTNQTLYFDVDGVAKQVTFLNPTSLAAVVSQINAAAGETVAAPGGVGSAFLAFTSLTKQPQSRINIISGTGTGAANILTVLGLTAGITRGTSYGSHGSYTPHTAPDGTKNYAIYYEEDATILT